MSLYQYSILCLLLFVLLTSSGNGAFGQAVNELLLPLKTLQRIHNSYYGPSCSSQKSRSENGATILEMKHKDYCSRSRGDLNRRLQQRLVADDIRVQSMQSHIKNISSQQVETLSQTTRIPITSGVPMQTLNYIVTMRLGGRNMTVIVDTGSDLTWVQCQPCRLCYSQPEPLFNPSFSSSYQSVACNSSACQSLVSATGNSGLCGTNSQTCNYLVSYGDGSYTKGELGQEHLVLGNSSVDNFVFGCGRNNRGLFGLASGLMGLGRSDLSLISQTSDVFGGVFSYCLPSAEAESSGSLVFGGDASVFKNSTPISYTKMVPNPQLFSFYFLNITGMTIGGVVVQDSSFGQSGFLIDSGTVITRLPPSIYKAVKAEFLKQFSGYPFAQGYSILDTCFDLSAYEEVNIPTIKIYFDSGAEMEVDVAGVFYFVKSDASQVCLALASLQYEDETGIIGNFQQRNTRVIYDTKQSQVGFAKETCSFM
ncbi:aspartyl protease family protein At5g10770-like [Nicotiana tomentosiformis]|uniref:aspartyl protease family protein At5g10770-like n=1 Tax=Nicotiana tomentosiformis TaxID=4098 RepID=UPI00051B678A|nr:aspartyl protease family protein At5g10770-like [Nicotiana tomentosiformis]